MNKSILIYKTDYLLEICFAIIFLLISSLYLNSGSSLSRVPAVFVAEIINKIKKITQSHGKRIVSVNNKSINNTQKITINIISTSMHHFIKYRKPVLFYKTVSFGTVVTPTTINKKINNQRWDKYAKNY